MRERQKLDDAINGMNAMRTDLADTSELIELGEAEGDDEMADEGVKALQDLAAKARRLQVEALLSGEADGNDTYVEIHSGAGGTESQDWANMLLRMYTRWAEQSGRKVELLEEQAGEEAGIKSATILVKGDDAYGWLKTEAGVHRLVRISPYDSNARRHTSFASVWIYPLIRHDQHRDQRERLPHRHLPRIRCRRSAREHHRFSCAHHAQPHRHRRAVSERALSAQE
jgi:peptide chain release factor 2